jgi:hypothetical protein
MGNTEEAVRLTSLLANENENTSQYHELRFVRARAYRMKTPPDNVKALNDLMDVANTQATPETECRARLEMAVICLEMGNKLRALGNYRQILAYDPATKGIHGALETAAAEGAKICAALGDGAGMEKLVKTYRELAPKGAMLRELEALKPAAAPASVPAKNTPPSGK